MNIKKNDSSTIPSILVREEKGASSINLSLASTSTITAERKQSGISIHVVFVFTAKGYISEEIPRITIILNKLLPMILPRVMSELPEAEAKILTISSGADVPKATIVSPITILGILYFFASDEAPSTRMFAPKISGAKPLNNIKRFNIVNTLLRRDLLKTL